MPLDLKSFPMHLFQASQERAWTAAAIDYSREREHWMSLADDERELLSRLVAGFRVGERGVTHELAPLLQVVRDEGRLDEELYVTAQIFEEARHVEFFERWIDAALPGVWGKDIPYPELSGDLFGERLPEVMRALLSDTSPAAQVRAVMTYHFYIEGVGAESSYPMYFEIFEKTGLFPALARGITLIRRDEARHIAFGCHLLQRLLDEHPSAEQCFEEELAFLEPLVEDGGEQTFAPFEDGAIPFGLDRERYRGIYRASFELQKRNVYERQLPTAV
jgi:ribonucleoside-diphosphate reductase beta chain